MSGILFFIFASCEPSNMNIHSKYSDTSIFRFKSEAERIDEINMMEMHYRKELVQCGKVVLVRIIVFGMTTIQIEYLEHVIAQ